MTLTKKNGIIQTIRAKGSDAASYAVIYIKTNQRSRFSALAKKHREIRLQGLQCSVGDSAFAFQRRAYPKAPPLYGSYTRIPAALSAGYGGNCRDGMGNCLGGKYETADNQR